MRRVCQIPRMPRQVRFESCLSSALPSQLREFREGITKEEALSLFQILKEDIGLKEHHERKARVFESSWSFLGM